VGVISDTNPCNLIKDTDLTNFESLKAAAFNVQFLDGHVRQLFSDDRTAAMGPFPQPAAGG
jgi:prepilin-type processing-associated H-X9-DG protein